MSYDYGYGELENKLIELFRSGAPDFVAAEKLIRQGADVNAMGKDPGENILSEILQGYWWTKSGDAIPKECDFCEKDYCEECKSNVDKNPELGKSMCQIIRFFLSNGFDVNKFDGCYGAQCLYALTLSTFDRYFLEATKILFDAGAKNRNTSYDGRCDGDTPWEFVGTEGSYQDTCEHNHSLGNIYEAVYQMYLAVDEGRPYNGIDTYETTVGKKILKVIAGRNDGKPIFYSMDLPNFKKENCFHDTLYFVYDDGVLITTQYADFWVDSEVQIDDGVDVSEHFSGIVGETIKQFKFEHRSVTKGTTHYGQPITTIEMESGNSVTFSINFGDVKDDERAAYFEIKKGGGI